MRNDDIKIVIQGITSGGNIMSTKWILLVFVGWFANKSMANIVIDNENPTAKEILDKIINAQALNDLTIDNYWVSGHPCAGIFSDGESVSDTFPKEGVILGSGLPNGAVGPDTTDSESYDFGEPGDSDLNALLANADSSTCNSETSERRRILVEGGIESFDACVFEIEFTIESTKQLAFTYSFGSEEYIEYVCSSYNDVFGLFVDGENIALLPNGTPVTINNVNQNTNTNFFKQNPNGSTGIEADGFTNTLTATKTVEAGSHALKFAVGDVSDHVYDSWVFLGQNTFQVAEPPLLVDEALIQIKQGLQQAPQSSILSDAYFTASGGTDLPQIVLVKTFTYLTFKYSSNIDLISKFYDEDDVLVATVKLPATGDYDNQGCTDFCELTAFQTAISGSAKSFTIESEPTASGRKLQSVPTQLSFVIGEIEAVFNSVTTGDSGGDPHFRPWGQDKHYSFHGECDLVLLHSDDFDSRGLSVHIRTTMVNDLWSFIEAAAVRVGETVVEFYHDRFYLEGNKMSYDDLPMQFESNGRFYDIVQDLTNKKHRVTYLVLGRHARVMIKSTKHFMRLQLEGGASEFSTSRGLLGDYHTGQLLGRDNATVFKNMNDFGMEWQVREDETIFQNLRPPQLPLDKCRMPRGHASKVADRRRLRSVDDTNLYDQALEACKGMIDWELCVQDVMMTGEIDMADMFA